jgi:hypothetical protein
MEKRNAKTGGWRAGCQFMETFIPASGVKDLPYLSAKTNGRDLNSIPKFFWTAKCRCGPVE